MSEEENKVKNTASLGKEEVAGTKIYEVGYLLASTVSTEDLMVLYGNLKELINSMGGEPIADEMPKIMPLAYTISKVVKNVRNKFDTAYFGWIKFAMDADKIDVLKKKLDLDTNIIRFLILKTVRENTIAAKRFVHRDMAHRRPSVRSKDEDGVPVEINKEEIDKEIDALIAV
jgi:ribosomal protein S6